MATGISSTEAGIISAIGAISMYLRSRPDFDEKELLKYVHFFKNTRQDGADPEGFNLALDALGGDPKPLLDAIKNGVGAQPR
ncbi:hypothetical protein YA0016_27240 [Pseudomonas syringae]|uniref:hypothetical protein n=1 Tax=Pseudomonas TaxID=286 RepID=UPI000CF636AA|nr:MULTISPECIES: hypothetical protein [Pseudomonas syringae group]AVI87278.1 hypothetical protein XJ28_28005 [Pseudomonas syringae pv. tomato]MBI6845402.1 hypothetical protein [Pseudomonas syringae]QBI60940.1 hypothetical protein EIZ61_05280 [Pseudomonas syringae]